MDITGNAFVTGGGSGIGKATTIALAKEGASGVLIADLNLKAAQETVAEATAAATNPKFRAEAIEVDVSKEDSVKNAVAHMVKSFGRIDYCVHSAGIPVRVPALISDDNFPEVRAHLDINVYGTYLVLGQITAAMKVQEPKPIDPNLPQIGSTRGTIVSLGSAASLLAQPGLVQYVGAKHAVLGIVKTAAIEGAPIGIRVNCICPSWVDTPMLAQCKEAIPQFNEDTITYGIPMNRIGAAKEIADVALFLVSPRSSFVTGAIVPVDGGMSISVK
ncbi:NAD(P)-binding protein [Hypoxylon trugodes]|uniref:NAD(P)-binding protein n=1 Tax=Hypoxylon trugodes TaxID=326681 RepID=UPI00219F5CAD|nr:NAD(P)-binding protein [Hypoxylon trugodes]KAI1390316.1 NAD(P)-binding protein [Hypoxylon trugodes]